jgi:hypothetical protein
MRCRSYSRTGGSMCELYCLVTLAGVGWRGMAKGKVGRSKVYSTSYMSFHFISLHSLPFHFVS